jgi:hypothetical protein
MAHNPPMQRTTNDLLTRAEAAIAEAKALRRERERILAMARMWTRAPQIALRPLQTEAYEGGGFMIGPTIRR